MFRGPALARAMALIMIAMSAAPGFSPLLGGALDHSFGWRSEFALVAAFAAAGAIAYGIILGETHNSIRTPLNLVAIARTYVGLIGDRRFAIPAATASLIIGGLFSMFSAAPRLFIEALHFTPIQLGLFFAGTVFIVFAAGMLATKLAPRYGLDRPIRAGLWATAASSVAILLISMISPTFLPFLGAMCVFLLGMGVVSPLATARALSPFGEKAGAASALLGFWQMMNAAIGVWLAATVSHEAMLRARRRVERVFTAGSWPVRAGPEVLIGSRGMKFYLCKYIPPRADFLATMTAEESKWMKQHGDFLNNLLDKGLIVAHGPVMDPSGGYGVSLYQISDDQDIATITSEDPIVKNGAGQLRALPHASLEIAGDSSTKL